MHQAEHAYREYRTKLLSFVRHRVGAAAAEDILHEVFLKLMKQFAEARPPTQLRAWLYQVTRNAIVDHVRADRRFEDLPEDWPDETEDPPALHELTRCLAPLIEALPETYRDAVRLSELQQLPLKDVARLQGLSLPGAKSRVQRGRRRLKQMLLECCRVELDRGGKVVDAQTRPDCC